MQSMTSGGVPITIEMAHDIKTCDRCVKTGKTVDVPLQKKKNIYCGSIKKNIQTPFFKTSHNDNQFLMRFSNEENAKGD